MRFYGFFDSIGSPQTCFDPFDRIHYLAINKFRSFHIEPLPLEKILLLTPLVLGDDYPPTLEAKLHARFSAGRLNKINGRKEFFRADLREIEQVIRANYDAVVEVIHTASAEQYRESLLLRKMIAAETKGPEVVNL